jgi:hypothetical protein
MPDQEKRRVIDNVIPADYKLNKEQEYIIT